MVRRVAPLCYRVLFAISAGSAVVGAILALTVPSALPATGPADAARAD